MNEKTWSVDQAREYYAFAKWGEGFFVLNEQGSIEVRIADRGRVCDVALESVVEEALSHGLSLPLLVRFPQILNARAEQLRQAFARACRQSGYGADYLPVYPVKVNQQKAVVQTFANDAGPLGLEAGSKPELLICLAVARPGTTIVCNGFKDEQFLKLALHGQQLGLRVLIVIDKLSELDRLLKVAEAMRLEPEIGVRIRLRSTADGHWQNSGGREAKFGIDPANVFKMAETLRERGHAHWLRMLHFHLGSQIADLADFEHGVGEATGYLKALVALGHPVGILDVGGGPAIDYEGDGTDSYFSANYRLDDYAEMIVNTVQQGLADSDIAAPMLITEAGRAMSAHHSVLLTDVIETETAESLSGVDQRALINLSIFQSLPDIWGLGHVFPVLPLHGLNQPPEAKLVLDDLTCDSDGSVTRFSRLGHGTGDLPLPRQSVCKGSVLAFFLTGAYQEALGDPHNLFGRTDAAQVRLNEHGEIELKAESFAQTVDDMIEAMGYSRAEVMTASDGTRDADVYLRAGLKSLKL